MPFGMTVAGDVFQCLLDQCFGQIKNGIVIAYDIMIVDKKTNHSNHDQALTTLLERARRCNVPLNYDKFQYKKQEVDFLEKLIQQVVASQFKVRCLQLQPCQLQPAKASQIIYWHDYLSIKIFSTIVRTCRANKGAIQRKGTFYLGTRTSVCLHTDEKCDC